MDYMDYKSALIEASTMESLIKFKEAISLTTFLRPQYGLMA